MRGRALAIRAPLRVLNWLAATTALCLLVSTAAQGAFIYVDADATGAANGSSWTDAHTDLQDALAAAVSGGEIWVAEGTYKPTSGAYRTVSFTLVEGAALYGGFAGTEAIRDERDWTAHETILSGDIGTEGDDGDNSYHVVVGADGATLDGFTVTAGNASEMYPNGCGGGMWNDGCSPIVLNCTFSGNAGGSGGGMYNYDSLAVVVNCTFSGNSANSRGRGGGMCNASSSPTVTSCIFSGNSVGYAYGYGGGMANLSCTSPTVTGCTFTDNHANAGGGIYNKDNFSPVVAECTFAGNRADGNGGGISNASDSSSVVTNSVFWNNSAFYNGGGMANGLSSSSSVRNCTFALNTAAAGGGIYNYDSGPAVTNTVLWGDSPEEMRSATGVCTVTYSCVQGGWEGTGNVDLDPLFVDAANGDLHVQAGSPCIDAADGDAAPGTDIEGNPRHDDPGLPNVGVGSVTYADWGAYEFQGTTAGSWVTVLSPPAGATCRPGQDVEIEWLASADASNVRIELSRDGSASWEDIAASTPNDRSYTWTATDGGKPLPQQSCVLRISDASDGDPVATSGTFTIFSGVWYVDVDAPAGGDGFSWATAFRHPQDATDAASGGNEVWVAEGTYVRRELGDTVLLTMKEGVAVYGGFAGTEGLRDERDRASHEAILDGEGNCYHVVLGVPDAVLDGFTVAGGNANGATLAEQSGGGMYNDGCPNLSIANCTFSGNAAQYGGGMYNRFSSPCVSNCTFSTNAAPSYGGGIYNYFSSPVLADCLFSNNVGGGMRNSDSSPSLMDCTFVGNTGVYGGAMRNGYSSPTLTNCTFRGNTASMYGGAIYNGSASSSSPASPTVTNCTFLGNAAGHSGGGMYSDWICYPTVTSSTFTGNTAGHAGGGLFNRNCSVTVRNSIFWGNSAPNRPEIYSDDRATCEVGHSCVQGGHEGAGNVDGDPLFVDGPSGDFRLSAGSPCIDAADGDAAPETDRDGSARHDDPGLANTGVGVPSYVDIGAYEFQGSSGGSWVSVLAPRAGSAWRVGAEVAIHWITTGDVSDVEIQLSRDGGTVWEIVASVGSNGRSCSWTVTDGGQPLPQRDCVIRVSDAFDGDPSAICGAFTIFDGIWYVDVDAPVGGDGLSWTTAFQHPRDGVEAASAGHEIWVAQGTYTVPGSGGVVVFMRDGVALYGGFTGTESTRGERDWKAYETALDGESVCDHVVVGASDARLDGFTVTRGAADYPESRGGGMHNHAGSDLTVANCTFSDNTASWHGGGMYNDGFWRLTVENCAFLANFAGDEGGGIYSYSDLVVAGCTFCGNAADFHGGSIYALGVSTISRCMFSGNTARYDGGGIFVSDSTVTNCTFWANSAENGDGGGVCNNYWSASFTNCTFHGNSAGCYGGGIDVRLNASTLTNCILWGNEAYSGQQIFTSTASPSVRHCNVQGGYAGAGNIVADPISVDPANGDLHLQERSPCIDAADGNKAPATDIEGSPRHDDPGVPNTGTGAVPYADMGAYESQGDSRLPVILFGGGCARTAGTGHRSATAALPFLVLALAAFGRPGRRRRLIGS